MNIIFDFENRRSQLKYKSFFLISVILYIIFLIERFIFLYKSVLYKAIGISKSFLTKLVLFFTFIILSYKYCIQNDFWVIKIKVEGLLIKGDNWKVKIKTFH